MTARRVALLAALAGGLALAALAQAREPAWHDQTVAAGSYRDAGSSRGDLALVGNGRGRRALAWSGTTGVHVAVARPGHAFGRRRLVRREKLPTAVPHLAMNSRGDTLVIYHYFDGTYYAAPESREDDCCYGVRVAVLRHDGRLSPVRTLTPRAIDVGLEGFAIDGRGRYGLIWRETDATIYSYDSLEDNPNGPARPGLVGRFSNGGRLGPLRKIDRTGYGELLSYVRGRPRALIYAGGRRHRLVERVAHRNGRFGARRTVARDLPTTPALSAAANERGDEVIAWTNSWGGHKMHAGTRPLGRPLRQRAVAHTVQYDPPAVAIGPTGAAAIAWEPHREGVLLATSPPGGGPFRDAVPVYVTHRAGHHVVSGFELAVDELGRTAIGWVAGIFGASTIHAAIVGPQGGRYHHTTFRGPRSGGFGVQQTSTFDAHGRASIVWSRGDDIRVAQTTVHG